MAFGLLGATALAGGGGLFALSFLEERFAFHPSRIVEMTPEAVGLKHEDVRLATADGESIAGWWIGAGEEAPTILFLHGNAGNISHRLHNLALIHRAGLSTLIVDYRGYGESSGAPSEAGLYEDARAAWRHLTEKRGLDPARIVLYGESIGSVPVLNLARELAAAGQKGPAALVLEGAFTSALDMGRRVFPFLPLKLVLKMKMENLEAIRETRIPTLFLHGAEDEIVPIRMARTLYEASPAPIKEFHEIPRAMHNTVWMTAGDEVEKHVREFVDRVIAAR